MAKGFFITIEGIDGVGKSSQLDLLLTAIREKYDLYVTKEPGDSRFGSKIGPGVRDILFRSPGTANLANGVGDLLFLADHVQNVYDIRDALNEGKVVVSDRYADSQFAYAASGTKRAPEWANRAFNMLYGIVPDLTLLLVARGSPKTDYDTLRNPEWRGAEDISWALTRANARRGVEAGKQNGKAWNDSYEQWLIQQAYLNRLVSESRTEMIGIWESTTEAAAHSLILSAVMPKLEVHFANPRQTVLDDPFENVA